MKKRHNYTMRQRDLVKKRKDSIIIRNEKILDLRKSGTSVVKICELFGMSDNGVRAVLKKMKFSKS